MSTVKHNINKIAFLAVVMGFIFYCYEYLLRISPSVMQTELMYYFKINATMFGTLSAFYYYSYTPMQLVVGVLVDKYDIKKVLLIATLLCSAGTFFISFSDSYTLAATGRLLQGFGSAFAWVCILKLGVMFLPPRFMGFVSGVGSVFGFLGAAAGQIAMGYVVAKLGFKQVLVFLAIIGVPLSYIIYRVINSAEHKLWAMKSAVIKKATTTFRGWRLRFLVVLKQKQVWQAGIIAGLSFLPTTVFAELWGVEYISTLYNYTKTQSSSVTAMIFVGWAIGSLSIGVVSIFFTRRMILMRIGIICALITSLVMLYVPLSYSALCLCCILFGMFSAVQVLTFPMGMEVVNIKVAGTAGAFVNFLCMLSGMLFQRFAGQMLDFFWSGGVDKSGVRVYSILDYKYAVVIIPVALGICAIFTLFLKDRNTYSKPMVRVRIK